jgi:hypothetical protein
MSTTELLTLSAFLILSALGAGFGAFHTGPFVTLWPFRNLLSAAWQKVKRANKGPRQTSAMPWRSKKGPKGQKGHACNTGANGNG